VSALLIALLFALVIVKPPRKSFAAIGREILCLGVLTLAPFLPWLIKNWWQTGNPLFPFFASLFAAKGGATSVAAGSAGMGIFEKRELFYGENFWQIVALPLRIFIFGRDDNPQYFDGVLTPVLILLLPWAFKGKWLDDKKFIAGFALLLLVYGLFLVEMRIRYILPIVPMLVILLVYGVFNVYLRIKKPALLFAGLLGFAVWHGTYLWKYFAQARAIGYLSGEVSRTEYLLRSLAEYPGFNYVNRETPANAKIYLLFIGRRAYYCDRDYFHDGGDLPDYLLGAIRSAKNAEQIEHALRQKQITYLMAREDLLASFLSNNLTSDQAGIWNDFAANKITVNFRDRGYAVYQLHG
jgi:hypothetical protein